MRYKGNSEGVNTGCRPMALYTNTVTLPRFVTVPLAAFGPAAQARSVWIASVRSGPSDDPGIARANPAQWFDTWVLLHRCPLTPPVTSVRANQHTSRVHLLSPD